MPSKRAQNGCEDTKKPQNTDLPTRILNNILYLCPQIRTLSMTIKEKALQLFDFGLRLKVRNF